MEPYPPEFDEAGAGDLCVACERPLPDPDDVESEVYCEGAGAMVATLPKWYVEGYCPTCAGPVEWTPFTRRTNEPKLLWIERRLTELGIPHMRNGASWHAPILDVAKDRLGEAWEILTEVVDDEGTRCDDVEDCDPRWLCVRHGGCAPYTCHC